jgi:hypothetical protein
VLLPQPKTTRRVEQRSPILAVLPRPDDREFLQFALALSHGDHRRLHAWTFHQSGSGLHPALRIALYGMAARTEADRAIRHLIESASRGAHVPVRPFSSNAEDRTTELKGLAALPKDTPLVVGRMRGAAGVDLDATQPLAANHPGPVIVWIGRRGPPLHEVLATSSAPHEDRAHQALVQSIAALERAYPTFRVRLKGRDDLKRAVADAQAVTLLFAAVDDDGLFGTLAAKTPLWERHAGTTALLFPPGARRDLLRDVLARLGEDESPTPEPVREPPRWVAPRLSEGPNAEISEAEPRSGQQESE